MKNLAIIPARSGSKGLKDKNIRLLSEKPLLQYSVEAAAESGLFDCIHVSTDSAEYAEIARKCGADVPFLRKPEFSTDKADSWSVVRFVAEEYKRLGKDFDMITLLQPTSPLRDGRDIQNAYDLFQLKSAEAVLSVSEAAHCPTSVNVLDESLSLNGFDRITENDRRQDKPTYYRVNGAIYMIKTGLLDRIQDLYGEKSYAYIMSKEKSIDIDDAVDFRLAEIMLEEFRKNV